MRTSLLIAAAGTMLAAGPALGATVFQESFESAPGTTYTLSNSFDDAGFDFFGRYAVPDNSNAARDDFQNGWHGSFGILGQDHDGDGFAATQSVTMANIDISSISTVFVSVAVGALNSEPSFNNYEASNGDGIKIFATIDAGAKTLIGAFAPNATGASDLYEDTNLDGIGDGVRLTVDLANFIFGVTGSGSLMTIEIEMTSTSSFEPLAIDNVQVSDVPAPGVLAVFGAAGLAAARRRRS